MNNIQNINIIVNKNNNINVNSLKYINLCKFI